MPERIHRPAGEVGDRERGAVGIARITTVSDRHLGIERWPLSAAPDTARRRREPSPGVRRLGRTGGDEAPLYWSVPVDVPASPCSPYPVARLGAAGRYRVVQGAPV